MQLDDAAFEGLEGTLKNLNMKQCAFEEIPKAIRPLSLLAFLDLAQNKIRSLHRGKLLNILVICMFFMKNK